MKDVKKKLQELKDIALKQKLDIDDEIKVLESKLVTGEGTNNVAWKKVELARNMDRPTTLDYIPLIFDDFLELHGDRHFSDDPAMIGGIAKLAGKPCTIIGHQRGRNLKENLKRNGGMCLPDGYRKAMRLVRQAEKFGRPVISFVDTQGAFPGVAAEERGIGEAIAFNLKALFTVKTPIVIIVIGQGGSGGALGIGIGDTVLMLENAVYSVISPEGCASILLRDATRAKYAAGIMKITAKDLYHFKIIDEIIEEPAGGAHKDPTQTASNIKASILRSLEALTVKPRDQLLRDRFDKFRDMGLYVEKKSEKKKNLLQRIFSK